MLYPIELRARTTVGTGTYGECRPHASALPAAPLLPLSPRIRLLRVRHHALGRGSGGDRGGARPGHYLPYSLGRVAHPRGPGSLCFSSEQCLLDLRSALLPRGLPRLSMGGRGAGRALRIRPDHLPRVCSAAGAGANQSVQKIHPSRALNTVRFPAGVSPKPRPRLSTTLSLKLMSPPPNNWCTCSAAGRNSCTGPNAP